MSIFEKKLRMQKFADILFDDCSDPIVYTMRYWNTEIIILSYIFQDCLTHT